MTKRLVDIDDEVLEQARRALGTRTLKDTVNRSLEQAASDAYHGVITTEDLAAFAAAARDLGDPEVMARAWE